MKWSDLVNREKWNEMIETNRIPGSGQLLAYLRTRVEFKPYKTVEEVTNLLGDDELLEIHLFDNEKEYRAVKTRGSLRTKDQDFIECTIPDEMDGDSECYREEVLIEHENRTLVIRNYLNYTEEGMAYVNNYRLSMGR